MHVYIAWLTLQGFGGVRPLMHYELNVVLARGLYYVNTMAPSDEQLNDPSAQANCLGDRNKQLRVDG